LGSPLCLFQKQAHAKAHHLRIELRANSLDNAPVKDYLLCIRKTVDALASIGDPNSIITHHIDVILQGLPSYYAPVTFVIENKFDVMDLDEVEVLLLTPNGAYFGQQTSYGNTNNFGPSPSGFNYFQPNSTWMRPQAPVLPPTILVAP
jgi:hypothetical protein